MAVVYFTSNASTGAGSLVEAVKNARPGDVIRPDETVFERGSTIEIVLASKLTINKDLTLDASPFRVRLDGGGATDLVYIPPNTTVEIKGFNFVNGYYGKTEYYAGGVRLDGAALFERCLFAGCYSSVTGGALFVGATGDATLNDCVVVGCATLGNGGGIAASGLVALNGSTVVGNCCDKEGGDLRFSKKSVYRVVNSIVGNVSTSGGASVEAVSSVVDVASSSVGFVASPPDDLSVETWNADAWQDWDLRLLDDVSPNPSPYRDSGDVGEMSQYDLQGNFRGRETSGVATCSPGAYETLQADLFWIGEPFPQEMVDAAPQNIRVANYRQTTGSSLFEADMTWEIPDGVSYASITGEYSVNNGVTWGKLYNIAKDATQRRANSITPGGKNLVRLRGVFSDGSYTAWSVITYVAPLELDGSDGEQSWELRLPMALSVVNPSFQTSVGWATSRFSTSFSDVAPQVGQTLFIGRDVAFNAPPSGRIGTLTVGGGTVLKFGGGTTTVSDLVAGIGAVLQGSPITGDRARLGDYFRAETNVFYTFALTEVGASVYIGNHAAYSTVVSTAPTYGILQLLPSSAKRPTLSGNYVCADFRVRVNSNVNVLPVAVSGSATVRSTLFSLGTDATSQYFERFFDGPVTLKLQGDATVGVPSPTRETWADDFTVDVSEATSATLKLNGQTVYGDAPTCAVALTGAAKIVERGLDVELLTLNADAALTVDGARGVVAELSVADGATVAFSCVDAILTATETATVGAATFSGVGYFATPQGTDLTAATFETYVRRVDYCAEVKAFAATATGPTTAKLAWSATDATARVCVERENAAAPNGWETLTIAPTAEASQLKVALSGHERFRIFDGATFTVDSAWFGVEFYQCRTVSVAVASTSGGAGVVWETNEGGIMFVDGKEPKVGENCCVYAKIKSPLSGTWVPAERVANVEATVWRTGAVVETTLGAVAYRPIPARTVVPGWNGVSLSPSLVLEAPILPVEPPVVNETEGYNFIWTPDVGENPIFPEAGTYRIQVVFTLDDGTQIYLTEDATVKNR